MFFSGSVVWVLASILLHSGYVAGSGYIDPAG